MQIGRWAGFRYTVTLESDSSIGIEGQKPVRPPTVRSTIRFRTIRGTADPIERRRGDRVLKLVEEQAVLDSVEVRSDLLPPQWIEQINGALSMVAGTETRLLIAEDGEVVEVKTQRVGGVKPAPEVQKFLDAAWDGTPRFPFRLPPAPVGVGGVWRFTEKLVSNGIEIAQVSNMTVAAIREDHVRIRIRSRQQAPKQDFDDPFRPDSMAHLDRYQGDGQGELTIDRLTGVPLQGRFSTSAILTVSADRPGWNKATVLAATHLRLRAWVGAEAGAELLEESAAGLGDGSLRAPPIVPSASGKPSSSAARPAHSAGAAP